MEKPEGLAIQAGKSLRGNAAKWNDHETCPVPGAGSGVGAGAAAHGGRTRPWAGGCRSAASGFCAPPALDGVWQSEKESVKVQNLVIWNDRRVIDVAYTGPEEVAAYLDDYAALLGGNQ